MSDIKNHISLWLPAPPVLPHNSAQRRLRRLLPMVSVLPAVPDRWLAPSIIRLDPNTPSPRLAA